MIPISIKGETIGKTIYNVAILVAIAGILGYVGFIAISGRIWEWRAHRAEARAETATETARVATKAAADADGAASNAAQTRGAIDTALVDQRNKTAAAAERAESYEGSISDDGSLPDDLMRELEQATADTARAADRLQRKGSRRGTAKASD